MTPRQLYFTKLCESTCQDEGWKFLSDGIHAVWSDNRQQLVTIEFFEADGQEFARLSTRIGPIEELGEERLLMALRVNAGLPYGALAVAQQDLVMIDTHMLSDVDLEEVSASVKYLARTADSYEKSLFGTDFN
jgi:hypothetical protein